MLAGTALKVTLALVWAHSSWHGLGSGPGTQACWVLLLAPVTLLLKGALCSCATLGC